MRRLKRRVMLALLALVAGCSVLQPACAPQQPACDVSDLTETYWDRVIAQCYEHTTPCDAIAREFEVYQAAVEQRCGK
jgi:hypothetical protein